MQCRCMLSDYILNTLQLASAVHSKVNLIKDTCFQWEATKPQLPIPESLVVFSGNPWWKPNECFKSLCPAYV